MIVAGVALVGICFLLFPESVMPPSGSMVALLVLWLSAHGLGKLFSMVDIPPLLGMLIAGIVLRNTWPELCSTVTPDWASGIRSFGLGNILMIAGMEIDFHALKKIGWVCFRLTVLPGLSEALALGIMGNLVFGMPFFLSLSMGFIIGAVSPAVVVTGMFDLQNKGYGSEQGIPSLVVAAASMDDVVAISGFSMASGLAFSTSGTGWILGALDGPITGFFGVLAGVTASLALRLTTKAIKTEFPEVTMLAFGLIMVYGMKWVGFSGSGFLGGLVMNAVTSFYWKQENNHATQKRCLHFQEYIWSWISEPLLFAIVGQSFDFRLMELSTVPKSCLCVIVCVVFVRIPMAYFALTYPRSNEHKVTDLDFKERCFVALCWMPKATVQAALGSVPLEMIHDHIHKGALEQYNEWGQEILTTAILSILITAPIGLFVIRILGHKWLRQLPPTTKFDKLETQMTKMDSRSNDDGIIGRPSTSGVDYDVFDSEAARFEMGDNFVIDQLQDEGEALEDQAAGLSGV